MTSNSFAQSLYIKYGDNYLKGKGGFEKNEIKAAECFQRAADEGDDRGIKRLKIMGVSGEEWTQFASYFTTYLSISSIISISPAKSQKAISGSIIQNSLAWVLVLEFSALNVGPNVYVFL